MGITLVKISAVYFGIGILFGYYMSMVHDYALTSIHVHINSLGWTSMALAGILYYLFPRLGSSVLGTIHFWLHNVGLPLMMIGLFLMITMDTEAFTPLVATGSTLTVLGVFSMIINLFKNMKSE